MRPLFEKDGFIICFDTLPEDISMHDHFVKDCGWTEEEFRKIRNYQWFIVEISAWQDSHQLGKSYLGGCCYKSIDDCIKEEISGYLPQMVEEAIEDARANLKRG